MKFIKVLLVIFVFPLLGSGYLVMQNGFKEDQLRYPRVRNAYKEKKEKLADVLNITDFSNVRFNLFIMAFKYEKVVEVWAQKKAGEGKYEKLIAYPFCASSGTYGPKRREGDLQIPEGVYHIDRFNPSSNFHLSLGINYPNKSDRILGDKSRPGGDIFIHGDCVTIGCIPLTDDKIRELYVLAVEAKDKGQEKIPVHIYPARPGGNDWNELIDKEKRKDVISLWSDLRKIYERFDENRLLPMVKISSTGSYVLPEE